MELVVTTGAVRHAELQFKCNHQQTNTQLFIGRMSLSNNERCQSSEGKTAGETTFCVCLCVVSIAAVLCVCVYTYAIVCVCVLSLLQLFCVSVYTHMLLYVCVYCLYCSCSVYICVWSILQLFCVYLCVVSIAAVLLLAECRRRYNVQIESDQ